MNWIDRGQGILINMDDAHIEAELKRRGWWFLFISQRDKTRREAGVTSFTWALLISDSERGESHAFVGTAGHRQPEDNGYVWYFLPDNTQPPAVELCIKFIKENHIGAGATITPLDFKDVAELN